MFNEYKKPMWNDGWSSIRYWNNLYNDYELNHCCFGDNGDSDSGGYGEETGLTADQAAAAAAAADAAAAAGASAEAQQAAADAAAAEAAGFSSVSDYAESEGISAADPSQQDLDDLYDAGVFGYNQMDAFDYFDKKDASIAEADAQIANAIQADAQGKGYDVNVGVDPDGTFSYSLGPDGTISDLAAVAGGQMLGGLMDLSPAANIAKAAGFELGDPRSLSAKGIQSTEETEFALENPLTEYQIDTSPVSREVTQVDLSQPPELQDILDRTLQEKENVNVVSEYDPEAVGFQAAYDRNLANLGPEYDPSATGYQEAYDRNLQETMANLAGTASISDTDGDNETSEDKKEEETVVAASDGRPRSIAEYFASDLVYPPSSFKPNQYLTALLQRINPNEDLESVYRRLGYYNLPPRTPTNTETGVA